MVYSQCVPRSHATERHVYVHTPSSPGCASSTWTDTDSDSDSDCDILSDDCAATTRFISAHKSKFRRTAPITIPQASCSSRRPPFLLFGKETIRSNQSELAANAYGYGSYQDTDEEEDEDDPSFYGNLAYFRSQHGHQTRMMRSRSTRPRSVSPRQFTTPEVTLCSEDDEEIFSMEL